MSFNNNRNGRNGQSNNRFPVFAASNLGPSSYNTSINGSNQQQEQSRNINDDRVTSVSKKMKVSSPGSPNGSRSIATATTNSIGSTSTPTLGGLAMRFSDVSTLAARAAGTTRSIACTPLSSISISNFPNNNALMHATTPHQSFMQNAYARSNRSFNMMPATNINIKNMLDNDGKLKNLNSSNSAGRGYVPQLASRNFAEVFSDPNSSSGILSRDSLSTAESLDEEIRLDVIKDGGFQEQLRKNLERTVNNDTVECTIQNSNGDRDAVVSKNVEKNIEKKKDEVSQDEIRDKINESINNKAKVLVGAGAQPPNGDDNEDRENRIPNAHESSQAKESGADGKGDESEEGEVNETRPEPGFEKDKEVENKMKAQIEVRVTENSINGGNHVRPDIEGATNGKSDDDKSLSDGSAFNSLESFNIDTKVESPRPPSPSPTGVRVANCRVVDSLGVRGPRRNSTRGIYMRSPPRRSLSSVASLEEFIYPQRGTKRSISQAESGCMGLCKSYTRPLGHKRGGRRFYVDLDDPGAERAIEKCDCEARRTELDADLQAYYNMIYSSY